MALRKYSVKAPRGGAVSLEQVVALIDDAVSRGATLAEPIQFEGKGFSDKAKRVWVEVDPDVHVKTVVRVPRSEDSASRDDRTDQYRQVDGVLRDLKQQRERRG